MSFLVVAENTFRIYDVNKGWWWIPVKKCLTQCCSWRHPFCTHSGKKLWNTAVMCSSWLDVIPIQSLQWGPFVMDWLEGLLLVIQHTPLFCFRGLTTQHYGKAKGTGQGVRVRFLKRGWSARSFPVFRPCGKQFFLFREEERKSHWAGLWSVAKLVKRATTQRSVVMNYLGNTFMTLSSDDVEQVLSFWHPDSSMLQTEIQP